MIMTVAFWRSAAERAIKTAASAAVAVIGTEQFASASNIDWSNVGGIALLAGVISILTSITIPTSDVTAAIRSELASKASLAKKSKAKKK